jgi:hypothetical protein
VNSKKFSERRHVRLNVQIAEPIREAILESSHFADFFADLDEIVKSHCDQLNQEAEEALKDKNTKHIVNMVRTRCAAVSADLSDDIARMRQHLSDNLLQTVLDCMKPVYEACRQMGGTRHNARVMDELCTVVAGEDNSIFSQVIDLMIKNMEAAISGCETRIQRLASDILTQVGHLNETKDLKKNESILEMLKSPIQNVAVRWAQPQPPNSFDPALAVHFIPLQAVSPMFFARATIIPVASKRSVAPGRLAAYPHGSGYKLLVADRFANDPVSIVIPDAHLGLEICLWILNQYSNLNFVDVPAETIRVVFECVSAFLRAVPSTLTTPDFIKLFQEEVHNRKKRKRIVAAAEVKAEKKPKNE